MPKANLIQDVIDVNLNTYIVALEVCKIIAEKCIVKGQEKQVLEIVKKILDVSNLASPEY